MAGVLDSSCLDYSVSRNSYIRGSTLSNFEYLSNGLVKLFSKYSIAIGYYLVNRIFEGCLNLKSS